MISGCHAHFKGTYLCLKMPKNVFKNLRILH